MITADRLRLEISRARRPFLWALWLLLCATLASWVVFKNQTFERPWKDYAEVRVAFADAKGMQVNHQVRVAGVPVGVVKRTELVDGRPVLTLSIEEEHGPLYRDARFRLRPQTPLADMYVAIERRGTRAAGELTADTIVPAEQTTSPVDVSRVLNTFNADSRRRMAVLLEGLAKGLDDRGGTQLRTAFAELAPFLRSAQRLTGVLAERRTAMRELVHGLTGVTGAVAIRDRQLRTLVRDGSATLGTLAAQDRPLAAALTELPATLTALDRSFAQVRRAEDELDPALTALLPLARSLEDGLGGLERFAGDAQPAFRRLTPAVTALRPLARDLAPTARSLTAAFDELLSQAPRLDRVTDRVDECLHPLQKFLAWSISVFKFGDANAAYTRADSTLGVDSAAGAAQDPATRHQPDCAEAR